MKTKLEFHWSDYVPSGIGDLARQLEPVFKSILPDNTGKSFDYHFMNYLNRFMATEQKETIVEEKERFLNYLKRIYEKDN